MPMWRCPHCGTPQAETARCWVCQRSSTACGTCRHFRRSVAAQLGYCGLDRRRQPLVGDEIRGCWDAWAPGADPTTIVPLTIRPAATVDDRTRHREFVEIDDHAGSASSPPLSEPRWSLWAELEG